MVKRETSVSRSLGQKINTLILDITQDRDLCKTLGVENYSNPSKADRERIRVFAYTQINSQIHKYQSY